MLKYAIEFQEPKNGRYYSLSASHRRFSEAKLELNRFVTPGRYRIVFGRQIKVEKVVKETLAFVCPVCLTDHGKTKLSKSFPNGRPKVVQACYKVYAEATPAQRQPIDERAAKLKMVFLVSAKTGNVRVEPGTGIVPTGVRLPRRAA